MTKIINKTEAGEFRKIKVQKRPRLAKLTHKEMFELYEQIFQHAPFGIYTINKQGYIDSFNPKMCELAGAQTPKQVIGLHALTLPTYGAIDLAAHIRRALEKGIPFDLPPVTYISYTAGKKSIRHFQGVPIRDEKGKVIRLLMLVEDVTERETLKKKLEQYAEQLETMVQKKTRELKQKVEELQESQDHLRQALNKLKELDRLKSEFIKVVSHRLRTPLSTERWSLEMLLRGDLGKILPPQKEFLTYIYQSNLNLIEILESMIEVLSIEKKKIKLKREKIDLAALITALYEQKFKKIAQEKGLSFDFQKPKIKIMLKADYGKLKRALEILMANAVQYNLKNGKIIIRLKEEKGQIQFSISDTGIGIAKRDLPRMFTKFFRAENAMRHDTTGLGLGLYIAKRYIEAHGGKIWVESEGRGRGSTFYFVLPVE